MERRLEMRLIVDDQSILAKKASVKRFGFESYAVAGEQQARADHVNGAGDDGGS